MDVATGGIVAAREIGACAKRGALRAKHDHTALGIGLEHLEGIGDPREHFLVEEVMWRLLNLDDADMAIEGHGNRRRGGNYRGKGSIHGGSVLLWCLGVMPG